MGGDVQQQQQINRRGSKEEEPSEGKEEGTKAEEEETEIKRGGDEREGELNVDGSEETIQQSAPHRGRSLQWHRWDSGKRGGFSAERTMGIGERMSFEYDIKSTK